VTGKQPVYHPQPPVPLLSQAGQYRRLLAWRRSTTTDPISFVIFAQGRTGSTLLVDLISSHPRVHCDDEILSRRVVWPTAWVTSQRAKFPSQHYGFKVKPYQLTEEQHVDPEIWVPRMAARGWRVIHLWRRNVLRHALSNMVAEHVGSFVFRSKEPPKPRDLVVDTDMLVGAMATRTEMIELERAVLSNVPHVSVCYEDDLLDPARHQATLDRLSEQLGLPSARAHTEVRRITEKDLRDMIANYDDVAQVVAATQWAPLLDA
jgi:hypothetical protein